VNQRVLRKVVFHGRETTNKFQERFEGPYIVAGVNEGSITYSLTHETSGKCVKAHYAQLRVYHVAPRYLTVHPYFSTFVNNAVLDEDQSGEEEAQQGPNIVGYSIPVGWSSSEEWLSSSSDSSFEGSISDCPASLELPDDASSQERLAAQENDTPWGSHNLGDVAWSGNNNIIPIWWDASARVSHVPPVNTRDRDLVDVGSVELSENDFEEEEPDDRVVTGKDLTSDRLVDPWVKGRNSVLSGAVVRDECWELSSVNNPDGNDATEQVMHSLDQGIEVQMDRSLSLFLKRVDVLDSLFVTDSSSSFLGFLNSKSEGSLLGVSDRKHGRTIQDPIVSSQSLPDIYQSVVEEETWLNARAECL
jgi:hypothetical protein